MNPDSPAGRGEKIGRTSEGRACLPARTGVVIPTIVTTLPIPTTGTVVTTGPQSSNFLAHSIATIDCADCIGCSDCIGCCPAARLPGPVVPVVSVGWLCRLFGFFRLSGFPAARRPRSGCNGCIGCVGMIQWSPVIGVVRGLLVVTVVSKERASGLRGFDCNGYDGSAGGSGYPDSRLRPGFPGTIVTVVSIVPVVPVVRTCGWLGPTTGRLCGLYRCCGWFR